MSPGNARKPNMRDLEVFSRALGSLHPISRTRVRFVLRHVREYLETETNQGVIDFLQSVEKRCQENLSARERFVENARNKNTAPPKT